MEYYSKSDNLNVDIVQYLNTEFTVFKYEKRNLQYYSNIQYICKYTVLYNNAIH